MSSPSIKPPIILENPWIAFFLVFFNSEPTGSVASLNCSYPYLPVSTPFLNVSSLKSRHLRAFLIRDILPDLLPAPRNNPVPCISFSSSSSFPIDITAPLPLSSFSLDCYNS